MDIIVPNVWFAALHAFFTVVFWTVLGVYVLTMLFWFYEIAFLGPGWRRGEPVYTPEDVQIRILTIGAEAVVQATVDSLPEVVEECIVVAEREIEIDGASVRVVPDEFECKASYKGRALEWARRHVSCDREFVLYLDEDSIVPELPDFPDADVVQLMEQPIYTGSRLAYLCEIFRIDFQIEQRSFRRLSVPFYAWGGGIAIRKELEDRVTWDFETVIEDTRFVWYATRAVDIDFRVVDSKVFNQAPPSIRSMIKQRRRWVSGSREPLDFLPKRFQVIHLLRNLSWVLSPLLFVQIALAFLFFPLTATRIIYQIVTTLMLVFLLVWCLSGIWYYRTNVRTAVSLLVLAPFVSVLHSLGALWGFVSPVREFAVTEKAVPNEIGDVSSVLDRDGLGEDDD